MLVRKATAKNRVVSCGLLVVGGDQATSYPLCNSMSSASLRVRLPCNKSCVSSRPSRLRGSFPLPNNQQPTILLAVSKRRALAGGAIMELDHLDPARDRDGGR